MREQILIVRLQGDLCRRLRAYVESGESGYQSVHEFISIAIENQLHLQGPPTVAQADPATETAVDLDRSLEPRAPLLESVDAVDAPLFVLTNRLSPLKIAARVLSNLAPHGQWPLLEEFQRRAALTARRLGQQLRGADRDTSRSGLARRWVAFPVGDDVAPALARFVNSFTMWLDGERSGGPMAILGIAGIRDGRAVLSAKGWELAAMPSPLLGEVEGATLSEQEAVLLRQALASAPAESSEVRLFLQTVQSVDGEQAAIDRKLVAAHPDWSERRAAAQRSAMIGRLSELGLLSVEGRGPRAKVRLRETALHAA